MSEARDRLDWLRGEYGEDDIDLVTFEPILDALVAERDAALKEYDEANQRAEHWWKQVTEIGEKWETAEAERDRYKAALERIAVLSRQAFMHSDREGDTNA